MFDEGSGNDKGLISAPAALLTMANRMGALEEAIKARPTQEKLNSTVAENTRRLEARMEKMEQLIRDTAAAQDKSNDTRMTNMQLTLAQQFPQIASTEVSKELDRRRDAEVRAEQAVDEKLKKTTRGLRVWASTLGPLSGVGLTVLAFVLWNWVKSWG